MQTASAHNCRACPLWKTRQHIVDGQGSLWASVLFIGEGPGEQEDRSGLPFVGQSGKLIRYTVSKIAAKLMLSTEQLARYTNAVRCRPPENRDPLPGEMAACAPWLLEEVEAMPRLRAIVALGKYGMEQASLVRNALGLTDLFVTRVYHPAYILRQRRHTREWEEQIEFALREAFQLGHPVHHVEPWDHGEIDFESPYFAMDTETDDLEEGVGVRMVGFSASDGAHGMFKPVSEASCGGRSYPPHVWLHNAKYDLPLLGIDAYDYPRWDDTQLGIYVLRQHERVGLKEVGHEITGLSWDYSITDLLKERIESCKTLKSGKEKCTKKWQKIAFSRALEARPEDATKYATTDAVVTSRLARYVNEQFERNPWARDYYLKYEKPLVPVLLGMETRGMGIDLAALQEAAVPINARLQEAESELRLFIPPEIKLTAPMQLGPWLLAHGLVDGKKTPTGHVGAAKANILNAFKVERREQLPQTEEGHIADMLLEAAAMRKLESTYVRAISADARRSPTGSVHPRFNQAATDTDRLSSSDFNAQNIPARGPLGAAIRRAFRARAGYRLVVGDYSQLELRIWAYITQDPFFLGAFVGENTYDPHTRLAEWLVSTFRRTESLKAVRSDAKNTNFAAIYGADDPQVAATAKIARGEISAFIEQLRAQAPSLSGHRIETQRQLDSRGFVETLLGWRGYYPLYYSPIRSEQQAALRAAGNVRVQGSASGIVKDLMIQYDEEIAPEFFPRMPQFEEPGGLLLQVHDELVTEVKIGQEDRFAYKIEALGAAVGKKWLGDALGKIGVPLKLSVDIGDNWSDAKPK